MVLLFVVFNLDTSFFSLKKMDTVVLKVLHVIELLSLSEEIVHAWGKTTFILVYSLVLY